MTSVIVNELPHIEFVSILSSATKMFNSMSEVNRCFSAIDLKISILFYKETDDYSPERVNWLYFK